MGKIPSCLFAILVFIFAKGRRRVNLTIVRRILPLVFLTGGYLRDWMA
jgi:hypothetical protein